ncbi:MAG: BrnT family toxin [Nitrospira sp.]|nr:BrnT family toxin [Nitrospira sp.]
MEVQILGFDWDTGNRRKCRQHGLALREIEAFFRQESVFVMPDIHHSQVEERYIAYGPSPKGRPMLVAFTFRIKEGETLIRPISARYMHAKEAREYEEKSSKI